MFKQNRLIYLRQSPAPGSQEAPKAPREELHTVDASARLGFGDEVIGDLLPINETIRRSNVDLNGLQKNPLYQRGLALHQRHVKGWFDKYKKSNNFKILSSKYPNIMNIVDLESLAQDVGDTVFLEDAIKTQAHNEKYPENLWGFGIRIDSEDMEDLFMREIARLEEGNERNKKRYAEKRQEKESHKGQDLDWSSINRGINMAISELFTDAESLKEDKTMYFYIYMG